MNHPKTIPVDARLKWRCAGGRPCETVVAKLVSADQAVTAGLVDRDDPHVQALRDSAARTAWAHGYGTGPGMKPLHGGRAGGDR